MHAWVGTCTLGPILNACLGGHLHFQYLGFALAARRFQKWIFSNRHAVRRGVGALERLVVRRAYGALERLVVRRGVGARDRLVVRRIVGALDRLVYRCERRYDRSIRISLRTALRSKRGQNRQKGGFLKEGQNKPERGVHLPQTSLKR